MSNDKQPEIRFPGFAEDWEERKLSDVASIVGGGTPSTSNPEYWDGDIDWYAPAEIGDQIYVNKSLKTITELGQQKSSAKILPIGTVLFTSRAGIGNTAILAKEGTTNQGFQSIVPHENKLDSYFIFSRTHELKRYGEVTGAGSTFAEVSGKQMAKMPILIPYIDEQRKIGAFFGQIDEAIALHQRKLDLLKETKKGFLQKMFPKNGAKVPEIRFPGFTEDWEERRLKQLGEIQTGNTPPTNDTENYNKNGIMWVTPTDINNLVISDTAKKLSEIGRLKARIAMKGSILVTCIASIGKNTLALSDVGFNQQINALTPNKEFDSYFLLSQSGKWSEKMKILAGRGTMQIVNKTDFSNITTYVPKYREQVKIGHFFKQLDDTIMLHQRKLDLLKETKKGFLQKMFV